MTPLPRATDDYDEAAHYVKLRFAEGEIDFIVATTLTTPGFVKQTLAGQNVRLETPVEIAIKKAHYRAENLKPRDIFDLAVGKRSMNSTSSPPGTSSNPRPGSS